MVGELISCGQILHVQPVCYLDEIARFVSIRSVPHCLRLGIPRNQIQYRRSVYPVGRVPQCIPYSLLAVCSCQPNGKSRRTLDIKVRNLPEHAHPIPHPIQAIHVPHERTSSNNDGSPLLRRRRPNFKSLRI